MEEDGVERWLMMAPITPNDIAEAVGGYDAFANYCMNFNAANNEIRLHRVPEDQSKGRARVDSLVEP